MPDVILAVESTDLFVGSPDAPRQVLRVRLAARPDPMTVAVTGPGIAAQQIAPAGTGELVLELGLTIDAEPGAEVRVSVRAGADTVAAVVRVARPGYTMHLVSHFHYDPVWWNTQAAYTSPWELLSGDATTRPLWERNGFALVDAHLELALRDPDYKFVLAEIDYLKPYFDVHPERRAVLRGLMEQGRVELLGGTYNEPNTNLTGVESTIRNIVYGVGYQRDILGGDPRTAWQLDAFGHDPQFPGLLAAAGLTGSAWARGPFHQWGPIQATDRAIKGDATVMQFPSEFEWLSPSGAGVLTHYMPHHYSAGWWMDSAATLADAEQAVYELYRLLKPVAATRHLLLPVGTDYTPPNKWLTDIHRSWNARYVWPRFVCSLPRDFLDAVRADLAATGRALSPQTRDMNPIYTGKDVSYIDTKQAQRSGEVAATDAEKLATLAALHGLGCYPHEAMDKVWRHLIYGAHHDAITGTESDQVYVDLLGGWREAHDLAATVRDTALDALTARIDTRGEGRALVVANTLGHDRSDQVTVRVGAQSAVLDETGAEIPAVYDRGALTFRAADVPALGWRTFRLRPATATAWTSQPGSTITSDRFRITADPGRGGVLTSIVQRDTGRELLAGPGNELRVYDEYASHPEFGEGPWHLLPTGVLTSQTETPARVIRETSAAGERLIVIGTVDGIGFEQTVTLWHGNDRIDFRTRIVEYAGSDKLVRVKFHVDLPGTLPLCDTSAAVLARGFALPDVDAVRAPWTLDNPAHTWFGLGVTCRVALRRPDGAPLGGRAIGVAEIVVASPERAAEARDLVVALARAGVTATTASADGSRYGWLSVDSNLPDVRIVLGGPDDNPLAAEILSTAADEYAELLQHHGTAWIPARQPLAQVWRPNADLRPARALPALIVAGPIGALVDDLADARIDAASLEPPAEPLTDATVALLTYGLPGFAVDPAGGMHLSLLRSCTGWPSGVWLDPPRRASPDGSALQLQHWTHEFAYALVAGDGDWRELALTARGAEFNTPLLARARDPRPGPLPARNSFLRVEPARRVQLSTLKPAGNPIAQGRAHHPEPATAVTVRLVNTTGDERPVVLGGSLRLAEVTAADLLERPTVPFTGRLEGFQVATLQARPVPSQPRAGEPHPLGPATEAAQPVYARYWLHNRGPAPMGFLPVTVAVSPGLRRTDGEPVTVEVALASHLRDADHEGVATLVVPPGWRAEPATRPYRLAAGGHLRYTATITPPAAAAPGLYFVAARLHHGGHDIEDVATVAVGEPPGLLPVSGPVPPDDRAAAGTQATTARDTGLRLTVAEPDLLLNAGRAADLTVHLVNTTPDAIRGELQLISPWGTWDWTHEVTRGFTVPAGGRDSVAFAICPPPETAPGHAWAIVKAMWFGRCQYSPTVALRVRP